MAIQNRIGPTFFQGLEIFQSLFFNPKPFNKPRTRIPALFVLLLSLATNPPKRKNKVSYKRLSNIEREKKGIFISHMIKSTPLAISARAGS